MHTGLVLWPVIRVRLERRSHFAHQEVQHVRGRRRNVSDLGQPGGVEALRGRRTDAGQPLVRQRMQEINLLPGGHFVEGGGLGQARIPLRGILTSAIWPVDLQGGGLARALFGWKLAERVPCFAANWLAFTNGRRITGS